MQLVEQFTHKQLTGLNRQEIVLTSTDANGNPLKIEWDAIADRPSTSTYAAARGGRFDELTLLS